MKSTLLALLFALWLTSIALAQTATINGVTNQSSSSGGSGITVMTTGSADPVAACTAPSISNIALYTQTTTKDVWMCVDTNTWKKILSTTGTGTYVATGTTGTAPSTPATGDLSCYYDSTSKTQICKDDAGALSTTVRADAGAANNFVTAISAAGVISKAQPASTNLSDSSSLVRTIAGGTSAMGTSAITSGACATVVTTTATGTATTDVITVGFNGDPTAITGYAPATTGMLTIIPYPSANNVNFKICNNTSSSISPGALTLNWAVRR